MYNVNKKHPQELNILSVGNSFSIDTTEHLADIALSLGCKKITLGNLYVGGCSLNEHFSYAEKDMPAYEYFVNTGVGWSSKQDYKISDAIKSEKWDWISIQHGSGDGSLYTLPESYEKLQYLVEYIKELAGLDTKIAFNMTWTGEPWQEHREMVLYGRNQLALYEKIAEITQSVVAPTMGLDIVSPTGTAIQNARTSVLTDSLCRDGYHLSFGLGRYIAGLTFFKALTNVDIANVTWVPEGVSDLQKSIAIESANNALKTPFAITQSEI